MPTHVPSSGISPRTIEPIGGGLAPLPVSVTSAPTARGGSALGALARAGEQHLRRLSRSHIAHLAGAGAAAQIVAFATFPLLARLYSPVDFGVLAQYVAVSAVVQGVAALRFDLTIPLAENDDVAAQLLALSLAITVATSLLVALAVTGGGADLLRQTKWSEARSVLWLLPLSVFGGGAYQSLTYFAARRRAFPEIARTKLMQTVAAAACQIALGVAHVGAVGLAVGQVANAGVGITRLVKRLSVRESLQRVPTGLTTLKSLARSRLSFAMTYSASAVVNQLGLGVHLILVGALYGLGAAGQLMVATRLLAVVDLIAVPAGQVYYAEACEAQRAESGALRRLFFRTSGRLALLGASIALLLWIAGPWAVSIVFGPAWRDAGLFARYLSVFVFANVIASPVSMTLAVVGKPRAQLAWDVGRLLMVAGAILTAHQQGWTVASAILAFSIVAALALLILFAINAAEVIRAERAGQPAPARVSSTVR
jgi:O-antigen/teichoic acid export membrane protein